MGPARKPRVVYWQNIPTPNVIGRFNALVDRGNLDFEAWFNAEREPDRSWEVNPAEWRFRARYIPARRLLGRRLHLPLVELRQTRPDVLVSLYDRLSFALGSLAARSSAARTAFRALPNYDSWSRRACWKELAKHVLFRAVDGAKVPGPDGAHLARTYGLPRTRIAAVTQSIDVAHYGRARDVDLSLRRQKRAQLGLHGCVFVYVGRLWAGKGLDYLFEAYRCVRERAPDTSLLLVGDGVDEDRYRALARDLPGIRFSGFVQPRDLPEYYALGDVVVFPTLGDPHGLVIAEALAAGLPVICTEAAGDIRGRLPDGRAGYVVPPADAVTLADRMLRLAADPALRMRLAAEAPGLVMAQVHDRWASDFEAFVGHLLTLPPRRTPAALLAFVMGRCMLTAWARGAGSAAPYAQGRDGWP
ncbi:MAG TPA: glycosyltransferase family 4 protein [Chloroflexota bacterium]|nr:glycosyltransferase family 4 protein [Chloroflexota bacterium]